MVQLLSFPVITEDKKPRKARSKKRKPLKKRLRESDSVELREAIPINDADTDLCISIWQSVIVQAIYDVICEDEKGNRAEIKASAMSWFGQGVSKNGVQTDFEMVCELAQMDPIKVMRCAKLAQKNGTEVLEGFNFRTLRKKTSNRPGRKT